MTELAQHVEERPKSNSAQSTTLHPGKLKLKGDHPATIYVAQFVVDGIKVGGFGYAADGDFFKGGIKWKCGLEFSKFVTFTLLPGVIGVDCDELPYSPVMTSSETTQLFAILRVEKRTEFRFFVKFPDGTRHDPEIIVTPITHTGDPEEE